MVADGGRTLIVAVRKKKVVRIDSLIRIGGCESY